MNIIDNAKEVVKIIQQIDNIELYRKILDLQSEINNLVSENTSLKQQLQECQERLLIQQSLMFEDNVYMKKGQLAKNNTEFVQHTAKIIRDLHKEPASVEEARKILGLS